MVPIRDEAAVVVSILVQKEHIETTTGDHRLHHEDNQETLLSENVVERIDEGDASITLGMKSLTIATSSTATTIPPEQIIHSQS